MMQRDKIMNNKQNLLFELYTEEIPASYQEKAIVDFKKHIITNLNIFLCSYDSVETGGTSNRLYVYIKGLEDKQKVQVDEIKGPPKGLCFNSNGEPTSQLIGFAEKVNCVVSKVEFKNIKGVEYAFSILKKGGNKVQDIIPFILEKSITSLNFDRSMKWGANTFVYARPILYYFCIYGHEVLKWGSDFGLFYKEIPHSNTILNNQILCTRLECHSSEHYFDILKQWGIEPVVEKRLQYIQRSIRKGGRRRES